MGPLGWQETVFIFLLALLIFGPKKLPELGKTIGKALTEFRRASSELKSTWDREMSHLERENESLRDVTNNYNSEIQSATYDSGYDSSYYDSGSYGYESSDSSSSDSSTVGASATEGAESSTETTTEGVVAAVAAAEPQAESSADAGGTSEAARASEGTPEPVPSSESQVVKT